MIIPEITSLTRQFIKQHIQTVWHLELLLLLRKNSRPLTLNDISRDQYVSVDAVASVVNRFVMDGLLSADSTADMHTYRYCPNSAELARAVDETARAYADCRTAVIALIFSRPNDNFHETTVLKPNKK